MPHLLPSTNRGCAVKSSLFATGLLGLAFAALWYFGGGAQPLPLAAADSPRVAAPVAHENLAVYFVHGRDTVPNARLMSLQEALERGAAVVHETSDVNTLAVENRSDEYELFIQSGDIVKGGKQDRMAATDMLVPPNSGAVPLPAHCVEQGRWTGRGTEDARQFASSEKFAAGKELKFANASGQQSAVWQNVAMNQSKLHENLSVSVNAPASPTSFQLTLEAPAVEAKVAEYEAALKLAGERGSDIIGVVFVVNGQVTGAEVYGSNALFRKAWPKLLGAAAVEAIAELTDKPTAPAPTAGEVEYFLARAAEPEPARAAKTRTRLEIVLEDTEAQFKDGQNINEIPLSELLQDLSHRYGVAFVLMEDYFTAEGMPKIKEEKPKLAVTQLRGLKLGNFLDIVLLSMNATFIVHPDHVEITTFERRMRNLRLSGPRIYQTPDSEITAQGLPGPASADGNRLNSNRTESRSTLVVESRDPARQNAVIHRSYIKK